MKRQRQIVDAVGVGVFVGVVFLLFQSKTIYGGDAGDLVSAICVKGVAHPPAFPLYILLGRILNKLPLYTPAWRVSLLSSLPAAAVVSLVFLFVWEITKNKLAGIITALSLAFSYLFWLYTEVPEVFSLNNFFLVSLTVLTFSLMKKIETKKLGLFFLLAGLSLSHHHFSLWFYPVFFFFIYWFQRQYWHQGTIKKLILPGFFFLLGLLPYLYIPLAARNYPVISWNSATNLEGFWRLVTRADYGTFLSHGASLGVNLNQRLFLFWGNFLLFFEYFGWLGICLFILGFLFLYRKERKAFWLISSLFLWEMAFIFYAGYNLSARDPFGIGVYERFLLPGVIFFTILLGCGLVFLINEVSRFLVEKLKFSFFSKKRLVLLMSFVFLLYPFGLFVKNYQKLASLRDDFTAENFARDILSTVPREGILLLSFDNPLFNTQYVHYCLGERADVNLVHLSVFEREYYYPVLERRYTNLSLPTKGGQDFLKTFLEINYSPGRIYTNNIEYFQAGAFIPAGLLYVYYPSREEIPPVDEVYKTNRKIWEKYHDPLGGILSWFRPTTLADVLKGYSVSAKNLGVLLFESGKIYEAEEFFKKATLFEEKDLDSRVYLARIFIEKQKCQEAEEQLLLASKNAPDSSLPYLYLVKNAEECWRDEQKADEFKNIYLRKKRLEEGDFSAL